MEVGFEVDGFVTVVGTPDFLHAFFSTIRYHLEPAGWGSRFPKIMKELYDGRLSYHDCRKAMDELEIIRSELKKFDPDEVIWSVENLSLEPPWGDEICDEITDLSNYFVTSRGEDLIDALMGRLQNAIDEQMDIEIVELPVLGEPGVIKIVVRGDMTYYMYPDLNKDSH